MKPNIPAIQALVNNKFSGNQSAFAREIGVERAQISKILKNGTGAGAQFFGSLMSYCKRMHLDFDKYIFLPKCVKKINRRKPA